MPSADMARRILLGAIGILTLILACFFVEPTRAVDIRCIDASKYKYLWQTFENNQQKFAEFLKVSPSQLPAPEMCRAILITGTIGSLAATPTSDPFREFDRLLNVIAMNNGWVAEIYLASPGGDLWDGMVLGQLARTFWLKTVAVGNGFFEYVPDFVAPTIAPPSSGGAVTRTSELDWRAYSTATRGLSHLRLQSGQALCASSCASLLVGGVDRRGVTYVHRGRVVGTPSRTWQVWQLFEGQRPEGFVLAFDLAYLQHMDGTSRCEHRKSSSSMVGTRTSDQTCRSPRHQAISVRSSILTSTRSVLTRRPRRLTWTLPGSITRHSIPCALRNRANQNAS